ncbi:hypothetical protein VL20_2301 [Microcystis panniformis FACHB-1757]|uniref:Uncharacterized protein n=1 Tax=Microcystis panniformis FACHB-1757 TaxID=1638788 RepID=A0A0K1RZT0_9CHRO|nr:hypothetical protein VL20_2301 [Microcystis panniformis FACHB-1757]
MSIISNSLIICSLSNSFSYNPLINLHFHCSRSGSFPVVAFVFRCAMTIIAKGLLSRETQLFVGWVSGSVT